MAKKKVRPKGPKLKNKLVETFIHLVDNYGHEQASFQKLADACNVAQATCLYYFKNRLALYFEAIQYIVTHNQSLVNKTILPEDNAHQRLAKYGHGNIRWAYKYPAEARFVILLYYQATQEKVFSKMYSNIRQGAQNRILEYLLAAQRENPEAKSVPTQQNVSRLHESLVGLIIDHLCERKALKGALEAWDMVLSLYLN